MKDCQVKNLGHHLQPVKELLAMKTLARVIREAIAAAGLTPRAAALKAGIPERNLSNFYMGLQGARPIAEKWLPGLAGVLDVAKVRAAVTEPPPAPAGERSLSQDPGQAEQTG